MEESVENANISAFNTHDAMGDISLRAHLKSILEMHENICMLQFTSRQHNQQRNLIISCSYQSNPLILYVSITWLFMSDTIDHNLVAFPWHGHLINQLVTEMYMSIEL